MCAICLAITCDGLEKLLNIVKHLASLKMYDTRKHFIYCGSYEDELRSIESTGYSFKTLNRQQNNNNITRLVTELNYTLDPYISTWTTHFLPQKSSVTSSCLFKPEMLAYANIFLMSKPIRAKTTPRSTPTRKTTQNSDVLIVDLWLDCCVDQLLHCMVLNLNWWVKLLIFLASRILP